MTNKNILLVTNDQQSATMLSCTGNPNLHTLNHDSKALDHHRALLRDYIAKTHDIFPV